MRVIFFPLLFARARSAIANNQKENDEVVKHQFQLLRHIFTHSCCCDTKVFSFFVSVEVNASSQLFIPSLLDCPLFIIAFPGIIIALHENTGNEPLWKQ